MEMEAVVVADSFSTSGVPVLCEVLVLFKLWWFSNAFSIIVRNGANAFWFCWFSYAFSAS